MNNLVLCLTNTVAANFTANVLLAIGAKPAMIEEPSEAAALAAVAGAMLVNVGTVTPSQAEVMRAAIGAAKCPWTLDPVAVQLLAYRRALVKEFLAAGPTMVRGNHDEIDFLFQTEPAAMAKTVVLSTGERDRLYPGNGAPAIEIAGGVPMLQTVTATGCAQGAVCAAMLARGLSPLAAAEAASRLMKTAGERAYARAKAPGAFQVALIDELSLLSDDL